MYNTMNGYQQLPSSGQQNSGKWALFLASVGVGALLGVVAVQQQSTTSLFTTTSAVRTSQPAWTAQVGRAVQPRSAPVFANHQAYPAGSVAAEDRAQNGIPSAAAAPTSPAWAGMMPAFVAASMALVAAALSWASTRQQVAQPALTPEWAMMATSGESIRVDIQSASMNNGPAAAKRTRTVVKSSAAAVAPSPNPLLDQVGLPKFASIESANVQPAVTELLESLKADFEALEAKMETTKASDVYAEAIEGMEKLGAPLGYAWGVVGHLLGVANSEDLRTVHQEMQPQVITTLQALGQSLPVYRAMETLKADEVEWAKLDEAQQRIVESSLRQMKHSGVGMEGEELEEFNKIALELAGLSTKFSNNVLDSTKEFELTLTTKEQVAGLPGTALALAAQTAKGKGHEEATPENGPWTLTLDIPSYGPAMQHLEDRDLREQLYRAYVSRASKGEHDNAPIITQILKLKNKRAKMLGYDTPADLSIASKMARSVSEVDQLSEMLRTASFDAAKRELAAVKAYAESKGFEGELALWDVTYWAERQKEELYAFKAEELRPYFSLPSVLDGLFGLCERIFAVKIVAADDEAEVWDKDVRFFKIFEGEEHIASFYLDPYSRPENKRGGAWMDVCVGASKVLGRKPVAYLTCNGSPPVGDVPSLMTFQEVETLFHETGHGLQHMLTRVEHGEAAGISNVEWDAVELPSQFMENWCYDRPTLYGFAKHYSTGEPLPEELYEKLKAQKNYNAGMGLLRQVFFQQMDMELHSRYNPEDPDAGTPFDVMQSMADKYCVMPPLPEDRFLCTFGHIFAGGYSAGYYSYKWAEVMSADAFAAFEEVGLDNEEAVKEVGKRFRETVLALGGGKHPADVYREFRGRDPTPDALIRHYGLTL